MRTGILITSVGTTAPNAIDQLVEQAATAAAGGVGAVWLPQLLDVDALTALAVIGREVPELALGTAVVPTFPRHPLALASQALTTQAAVHGRLHLGIGLSHRHVIEDRFGLRFDRPVAHLREYLTVLLSVLRTGTAELQGDLLSASTGPWSATVAGASPPPPVLVAALGPQLLRLTGELADGTVTWMVGPKTLEQHIVPTITAAADAAGRPAPRIVVGVTVCVTHAIGAARDRHGPMFHTYQNIPSYRAMLDREGASAVDLAIIGDEESVATQLARLADLGATEIVATGVFGSPQEQDRTWKLLGALHTSC